MTVVEGDATIEQISATETVITASDKAILEFSDLSVNAFETLRFVQPSSESNLLARITGAHRTDIFGQFIANGGVILVNPNGVYVGATADVRTGSFVATTLDIQNELFRTGQLVFEGNSSASVRNDGSIQALNDKGYVALLAQQVANGGVIEAKLGTVVLGSAKKATLSLDPAGRVNFVINEAAERQLGQGPLASNTGTIEAGRVLMDAKSVNKTLDVILQNSGTIRATRLVEKDGVIELVADNGSAEVAGSLVSDAGARVAASEDIEVTQDLTVEGDLTLEADSDRDGEGSVFQGATAQVSVTGDLTLQASGQSELADLTVGGTLSYLSSTPGALYREAAGSAVRAGSLVIGEGVTLESMVAANLPGFDVYSQESLFAVLGDWINSGLFIAGHSRVELMSTADARVTGNNDFFDFYVLAPEKTVSFEAGSSQRVLGTLAVQGSFGKLVTLRSTQNSVPWMISILSDYQLEFAAIQDATYVYAHGPPALDLTHSKNLGNNSGFSFQASRYTGLSSTLFDDANNWSAGFVPTHFDNFEILTSVLLANNASLYVTFEAGKTYSFQGQVKIKGLPDQGADEFHIKLRSAQSGAPYFLESAGPGSEASLNNFNFDLVNIQDITFVHHQFIPHGVDAGNNSNVLIDPTWDGGGADNNWSTANNWSGNAVPTGTNAVLFDGTSTKDATIDNVGTWSGGTFTIASGYTGTITQAAAFTASDFSQADGTFAGGSQAINVTGNFVLSGGTFTSTSGTLNVYDNWTHTAGGTFNHNNGTVLWANGSNNSTWNVNTTETFNILTVSRAFRHFIVPSGDTLIVLTTFNQTGGYIDTGTIEVQGNMSVGTSVNANGGDGTISFLVAGNQTITSSGGATAYLNINKPSGTVDVSGTDLSMAGMTLTSGTFQAPSGTLNMGWNDGNGNGYAGNWTQTGGTFTHNSGTVVWGNGVTTSTWDFNTSVTLYNFTVNRAARTLTIASGDSVIVANTFTHTAGSINTGTVDARGNVNIGASAEGGTALLLFSGTASQTYTDSGGTKTSGTVTVNKASGTVTLASNMSYNTAGQDLTITSGTLDLAGYNLTVNDVFTLGASGTLQLQGGETVSTIDTVTAGSTVIYNGTGSYTTSLAAGNTYSNLTFNGAGGTWEPNGAVTVGQALTVTSGTFNADGRTVGVTGLTTVNGGTYQTSTATQTLGGGLTVSSGTLTGSSGTVDVNGDLTLSNGTLTAPSGTMTVSGNFAHSGGTFTHNSGTVTLDGTNQTVSGNTTFYNLTKTDASNNSTDVVLTFAAGSTTTISGLLTITGIDADDRVNLVSSSSPTEWNLVTNGTLSLSWFEVTDSDATGSTAISHSNAVNGGNTTGWSFGTTYTGTVYTDEGVTNIGSGKTIAISVNGGAAATADTNGSGVYSILAAATVSGDILTIYIDGETEVGVTITITDGSTLTGFDIYQNRLILRHETAGPVTNTTLDTANNNGDTDIDALYTVAAGVVTMASGKELFIRSGSTYTPGAAVNVDDIDINGTFTMGANTVTVTGTWDATGGSFSSSGTVNFTSSSPETITSNSQSFSTLTVNGSGSWAIQDALSTSAALNVTAGTLNTNSQRLTVTGAFTVNGGTFTGSSARVDANGNLSISSGAFTAPSGVLSVAGAFTHSGGTFTHNSGSVVLDNTSDQNLSLSGGTTFNNLYINDGLIGYWKLDGDLADASGYANAGTANGNAAPTATVPSTNYGNPNAYAFDGTGDYISLSDSAFPSGTQASTLAAWIYPTTVSENNIIFYYGTAGNGQARGLEILANANFRGFGFNADVDSGLALAVNQWSFVALTYDGTTQRTYVNGVAGSTGTAAWNTVRSAAYIGADIPLGGASRDWKGNIDDVRIYNRALTAQEIQALAVGNNPGTSAATTTLEDALDVNDNLVINSGTLDTKSGENNSITVAGSFINNGGKFTPRSGTVTLDGTAASKELQSGGQSFNNLTVNGTGGSWSLRDRLDVDGTLTITNGTLDVRGSLGAANADYTIHAGTWTQTGGTFTARSGTVVLDKVTNGTFTPSSAFNILRIEDPTENGLVGYWKFDEENGTVSYDQSGSGNNGTLTNTPFRTESVGTVGFDDPYALSFDGTNDRIEISTSNAFTTASGLTLSAWVKINTIGNNHTFIWKDTVFQFRYDSSNRLNFRMGDGSSWEPSADLTSSTGLLSTGTWYHVAAVYDSATDARTIYLNGTSVATDIDAGASGGTNNTKLLAIGANKDNTFDRFYLNGYLDDVRIYTTALGSTQIANLAAGRYASGSSSTATQTLGGNLTAATLALDSGNLSTSTYTAAVTNALTLASGNGSLTQGSGTMTLTGGLTVSGGTYTGGSGRLDINNNFTLSSGSFTAPSGTLSVSGAFTHSGGTFSHNSGTVVLDNTSNQNLTLAATTQFNDLYINDGLVGYWKFNGDLTDASGYGASGTGSGAAGVNNTPQSSTSVPTVNFSDSGSYSFDGTDDTISITDSNQLDISGAITLAVWLNAGTATGGYEVLIGKRNLGGGETNYQIFLNTGNRRFGFYNGTNIAVGTFAPTVGQWVHLAATVTGATALLYVNGSLQDTLAVAAGIGAANAHNLLIGSRPGGEYLSGSLDDIRIYNRVLSQQEVQALALGNQPGTSLATTTIASNPLDVNGNLVINSGTLDVSASNYAVAVAGNLDLNGGKFTPRSGTLTLDGTSAGKTLISGGQSFNNLTVNGIGGGWNLSGRLDVDGTLTIANGTLDVRGSLGAANADYTIHAGTWTQTGGTFTARSGTVVLDKATNGTLTPSSAFNILRIEDPTENGLVGYWKFDEENGSLVYDYSGNGNNGTMTNTPFRSEALPTVGFDDPYSMSFDGTNDYVVSASNTGISGDATFTIAGWIYWNSASWSSNYPSFAGSVFPAITDRGIAVTLKDGQPALDFVNNRYRATSALNVQTWYHIAVTKTAGAISSTSKVYVNGVEVAAALEGSNNTPNITNAPFEIGRLDGSRYFNGYIDDVRLYSRALTSTEVANLASGRYAAGSSSTATQTLGGNLTAATLALDSGSLSTSTYTTAVTNALTLANGNGSLTQGSGTMTLAGGLTVSGSTYTGGSGRLDINNNFTLSSGAFTAPSGTMSVSGAFTHSGGTFTHNSGSVVLDNTADKSLNLSAGTTFNNLYINDGLVGYWKLNGTLTDDSGYGSTLTANGDAASSAAVPSSSFSNSNSFTFDGTGDYLTNAALGETAAGNLTLSAWVRSTSGGTMRFVDLAQTATFGLQVYFNGGKLGFDNTGGPTTAVETAAATYNDGNWHHVLVTRSGTTYTLYVDGTSVGSSGGSAPDYTRVFIGRRSDGGSQFTGNADDVRVYNRALSAPEIAALAAGNLPSSSAAVTTLEDALDVNGDLVLNTGTLDVKAAENNSINVAGNWENNGGIFTARNGTVTLDATAATKELLAGNSSFYNLTLNDGGGTATFELQSALDVNNNLTITGGTLDVKSGKNYGITVGNNWTNADTFNARNGTVTFDATDTGNTITDGGSDWYNVTFNGAGGGWSFADATVIANDLTVTAGTLSGTNNITVNGGDVTGNGTINLTGGTFLLDGAGNFGGNTGWTFNNLTFGNGAGATTTTKTGSGAVTVSNDFTIAANQTLDAGDDTWNIAGDWVHAGTFTPSTSSVVFNGTNQSLTGSTVFYNLTKNVTSTDTLTFTAGSTQTVTNALDWQGIAGNLLSLRSSVDGTQWLIDPQGTRTVGYVDVKDSNNINVLEIDALSGNSTDSGNNLKWSFPVASTPPTSLPSTPVLTSELTQVMFPIPVPVYTPQGSTVLFVAAPTPAPAPMPETTEAPAPTAPDSTSDSTSDTASQSVTGAETTAESSTPEVGPTTYHDIFGGTSMNLVFTLKGGWGMFEEMQAEIVMPLETFEFEGGSQQTSDEEEDEKAGATQPKSGTAGNPAATGPQTVRN